MLIFVAGPPPVTTLTAANIDTWRQANRNDRMIALSQYVGGSVNEDLSPYVAGSLAIHDETVNKAANPNGITITGVTAPLAPSLTVNFQDASSDSSRITRDNGVMIGEYDTLRWLGARFNVATTSTVDTRWIPIRRIVQDIERHFDTIALGAINQSLGPAFYPYVADTVTDYFRTLTAEGQIAGGSCVPDPTANLAVDAGNGIARFRYTIDFLYPAQTLYLRTSDDSIITLGGLDNDYGTAISNRL